MSHCKHGFPWLSHSSHPTGLLNYILCPYRAIIDNFLLVGQHLHVHVKGSIGEHHMHSSLLLQQYPICLVCLIWMVLEMRSRWPFNCCFMGCCFRDLFNIAYSVLVQFPSSFLSISLVSVHVVHPYNPYSKIDTTAAWKKLRFILSDKSDFYKIDDLSIAVHASTRYIFMLFSVDETLLLRYVNLFSNFREPPAPDNAEGIRLRLVYLQEALCHHVVSVGYHLLFSFLM